MRRTKATCKVSSPRTRPPSRPAKPIPLFKSHREGYRDGQQLRDFIYVADCVAAMMWLLDHPDVSGLFNLGTGKARSFLDLILAIERGFE